MSSSHNLNIEEPDPIAPWTTSWQHESANQSQRPPLDLLIEPVWFEFTDFLPKGARLLDLATGNGTVARSCAERAQARRNPLQIEAVDAADIDPPAHPFSGAEDRSPKIRFQGGIWLEDLPFRNDGFNAVISQFGFEYAEEARAISEVARVLSPEGKLRFIIHARHGAVWNDIDHRYRRLCGILAEDGAANLVLALVQARRNNDVSTFNEKLDLLPAAVDKANKLAERPPSDDSALFYAREFLYVWAHRSQYRLDDLLNSLEDGWVHATGTATRYGQMLQVARSAEDIAGLCERFRTAGLTIKSVRQICSPDNGASVAWQVDARKDR